MHHGHKTASLSSAVRSREPLSGGLMLLRLLRLLGFTWNVKAGVFFFTIKLFFSFLTPSDKLYADVP